MTTPPFINRLNWRLILLHFAARWCFAYAFNLFYYLHDLELVRLIDHYMDSKNKNQFPKEFGPGRLSFFVLWMGLSVLLGEVLAFIISVLISLKKRWFWLNSLIAFLVSALLIRFHVDGWRLLRYIFLKPGRLFGYPSAGYFILNGGVLLILGLLCLFLPAAVRFVQEGSTRKKDENLKTVVE